jgi:hypothetical protein
MGIALQNRWRDGVPIGADRDPLPWAISAVISKWTAHFAGVEVARRFTAGFRIYRVLPSLMRHCTLGALIFSWHPGKVRAAALVGRT